MVPTGAHWARTVVRGRAHLCPRGGEGGGRARLCPRGGEGGGRPCLRPGEARTPAPAGGREGLRVVWWDIISSALQFFYFPWAEVGPGLVVFFHRGKKLNK
jgi:hypothetical protein